MSTKNNLSSPRFTIDLEVPQDRRRYPVKTPESVTNQYSAKIADKLKLLGITLVIGIAVLFFGLSIAADHYVQQLDLSAMALMNSNHGRDFEEFCENTRHEPYEYWAAFDETGKKVSECTSYDGRGVGVPHEVYDYSLRHSATTIAHSHSSHDDPFSLGDLEMFIGQDIPNGITETYVVGQNYLYRLQTTDRTRTDYTEFIAFMRVFFAENADDPTYFNCTNVIDGTSYYTTTDVFVDLAACLFGLTFTKTPLD